MRNSYEIRNIRIKISEKYDNDFNKLLLHYNKLEDKLRDYGKYKFVESKMVNEKRPWKK